MAATVAATSGVRGANTINSIYFKPMVRKAWQRNKSSSSRRADTVKMEEEKNKRQQQEVVNWVPDERSGIFYPKGQEKVIQDIPPHACRNLGTIHCFSTHEQPCDDASSII